MWQLKISEMSRSKNHTFNTIFSSLISWFLWNFFLSKILIQNTTILFTFYLYFFKKKSSVVYFFKGEKTKKTGKKVWTWKLWVFTRKFTSINQIINTLIINRAKSRIYTFNQCQSTRHESKFLFLEKWKISALVKYFFVFSLWENGTCNEFF